MVGGTNSPPPPPHTHTHTHHTLTFERNFAELYLGSVKTFTLGKFTNIKALFPLVSTGFSYLVHVKSFIYIHTMCI